ncbi:MAG: hypothetical protein LBQ77_07040 [Treponema sp.]|nr:hypothetical protein [Treponema sp.]
MNHANRAIGQATRNGDRLYGDRPSWGQTSESKIRLCHNGDRPQVKRGQTSKSKIRLRHNGDNPKSNGDRPRISRD